MHALGKTHKALPGFNNIKSVNPSTNTFICGHFVQRWKIETFSSLKSVRLDQRDYLVPVNIANFSLVNHTWLMFNTHKFFSLEQKEVPQHNTCNFLITYKHCDVKNRKSYTQNSGIFSLPKQFTFYSVSHVCIHCSTVKTRHETHNVSDLWRKKTNLTERMKPYTRDI